MLRLRRLSTWIVVGTTWGCVQCSESSQGMDAGTGAAGDRERQRDAETSDDDIVDDDAINDLADVTDAQTDAGGGDGQSEDLDDDVASDDDASDDDVGATTDDDVVDDETRLVDASAGEDDEIDELADDDAAGDGGTDAPVESMYTIQGLAQKGPFIRGSTVVVSELDESLVQTGRTFSASIVDDSGVFEVPGVELASPFAKISVDGFYYNEISASLSDSRLELSAFVDVTDATSVNVNVMTHLESARIEYLVRNAELTFAQAKEQAHAEVLALLGFDAMDVPAAETLDVGAGGAANAKLLALSIVTQGFGGVAELTELLSRIQTDLRTDGTLDGASTGSALINVAAIADLGAIRVGLEARYSDLGLAADVSDFEAEIQAFLDTTTFERTNFITYPETGSNGCLNLLGPSPVEVSAGVQYCLVADVPEGGHARLRIEDTSTASGPHFSFSLGFEEDWRIASFTDDSRTYELESVRPGVIEVQQFDVFYDDQGGQGSLTLESFEFGAMEPTIQKSITWQLDEPTE